MRKLSRGSISLLQNKLVGVAFWGVLLSACATMSLTRQDVMRQYAAVAQLSDGLEDARGRDGALLAPNLFEKTKKQLDQACKYARKADKQRANEAAQRGIATLRQLNKATTNNRREMEEVIDIRVRANMRGAAVLFKDKSKDADERFRVASRLLEQGEIEDARKMRPELIETYAKLELAALKKGTVAAAKKAISAAEEADADDHAPKTLQNAREELKLALSVLDADRTRVEKSNAYAHRATWLARRAHVITDLIKYFGSQNFSKEERVLWYQDQLQRVRRALRSETLPFDQSNTNVIQALRSDSLALKSVMKDIRRSNEMTQQRASQLEQNLISQRRAHVAELQSLLRSHEQQLGALNSGNSTQLNRAKQNAAKEVAALKQRLSSQALAQAETQRRERRSQERFKRTQNLFNAAEAEVFRQGNNVLIRLKGFSFKPGKHEVEARNYALLNKVVSAINTFPESSITITGHTDTRGSDKRNLELSALRAQSVVGFLSTVGGVKSSRLAADGKGEGQPLASNETAQGRAKNRRIDLLILNNEARVSQR